MTDERVSHLTIADVARCLRVHPKTIYRMVERGELRGVKVGRVWRVPAGELLRYQGRDDSPSGGVGDQRLATDLTDRLHHPADMDDLLLAAPREGLEQALAASERRNRLLAEHSRDALALLDNTGRLIYISPSVQNVLGYTPEELTRLDPFAFVQADDLAPMREHLTDILHRPGEPVALPLRIQHRDGTIRTLDIVATNLLDDPMVQAIVVNFRDITAQRRAEEELRTSHDQLEAILHSVADGITVQDASGALLYANEAAVRLIGVSSVDALLNTPRPEILQPYVILDEAGLPVPPEEFPGRRALIDRRATEMVMRYRSTATGEERWSSVRAVPVLDEYGVPKFAVSAFQDITALKQAQVSLRFLAEASTLLAESLDVEATLRTVTQLAVPALADVCVVDLVDSNGQLERFSVRVPDGVSERPAWDVARYPINHDAPFGPAAVLRTGRAELLPEVSDEILQQAARGPAHLEMLRRTRITSHIIVPLRSRGEMLGLITLVSTKSRRRYGPRDLEIAEELAQRAALAVDNARLYHEAKQALADAQTALAVRDQFLSIASHELRTPLTSLKGHLELGLRRLQRDVPREAVTHSLETATAQVNRLNRLVGELLDVSRLASGRFTITPEPIELAALLARIVDAEQGIEPVRTLRLSLPSRPVHVLGDPSRIEQVIVNLVSNARKYSPMETAISVALRWTKAAAIVEVHDDGIGIPPEERELIFSPFHRAANVDRAISGLGLGLYIAYEIVQAHGGTLTVQSTPDCGSTFAVSLPAFRGG